MRKMVLASILAAWGALLFTADANPTYENWKNFKPGSFVRYGSTMKVLTVNTSRELTLTLREVSPEKIVLEKRSAKSTLGYILVSKPVRLVFPARGEGPGLDIPGIPIDIPQVTGGDSRMTGEREKMTIRGQIFDARKCVISDNGTRMTAWYCKDIPGGLVKASMMVTKFGMSTIVEIVAIHFRADR